MSFKKLLTALTFVAISFSVFAKESVDNVTAPFNNYSTQMIGELVVGCVNGIFQSSQGTADPVHTRYFCYCVIDGARNELEETEFSRELQTKGFGAVLKYVQECNAKFDNPQGNVKGLL